MDPSGLAAERADDISDNSPRHVVTQRAVEATRELEEAQAKLHQTARGLVGVTGDEETPPLREAISRSGVGWYPMLALSILVIIDEFQSYGFFVLGPEISRGLGISKTGLAAIAALKTVAIAVATLPMAAYVQHRPRRALVSIITAFAWSITTLFTGFVTSAVGLMLIVLADGASTGSVAALHRPLLVDSYPPEVRVRALSFYRGGDAVGNILAPLIVGLLTTILGFTWRGVFLAMGVVSLVAASFSIRLRDPGFGTWDTSRIRKAVRDSAAGGDVTREAAQLKFFEIMRRLFLIPTIRKILVAYAVLGMLLIPLNTYTFFFLEERWGLGPGARSLFFAGMAVFSVAALALFGRRGEGMFRRDPARLVTLAAVSLGTTVVAIALAIGSPWFIGVVLLFGVGYALFALVVPALNMVTLSIVPPQMRPHASALLGIFLAAVGGFAGLLLLSGIDRRYGTGGAIASLALPGVISSLVLLTARKTINADLDRMLRDVIEEEELAALAERGTKLPMLACRRINFSYAQLQVLFDVEFAVDEGEMVALLGTNGAGKSTLLRVISGLGLPSSGMVRFDGADITYLDAERRVRLGISQVPGGRGVFGPLSVLDNLRVFGYTHGRDKRRLALGVDEVFAAFPQLATRRDQPASTLSGGEQQMLALGRAFILKPRLLLIDELSLGLAPVIVTDLLSMVRRINQAGASIVLVEQSVNIALSVVEHAYFMEKGQIRFDGRASELLERRDLLRSVFLEGATKGLSTDGTATR